MVNNVVSSVDNICAFIGWNRLLVTGIIFTVIIVFAFVSGLWATTITDLFQVLIGVIVIPTVFFLLAGRYGWIDAISANWTPGSFGTQGFVGELPGLKLTCPSLFNFVICFAVALIWSNNYYRMKVANCRSEKVARRSFVLAAIILFVLFMVPLSLIGGYKFVAQNGIKSMQMSAICSHLTRRDYAKEGGLLRRKLRITEKGAAILKKYS